MLRARAAYRSVFTDSSRLTSAGETHATITVRLLPPRLSCSIRVSLLSRYGTCRPCSNPKRLPVNVKAQGGLTVRGLPLGHFHLEQKQGLYDDRHSLPGKPGIRLNFRFF